MIARSSFTKQKIWQSQTTSTDNIFDLRRDTMKLSAAIAFLITAAASLAPVLGGEAVEATISASAEVTTNAGSKAYTVSPEVAAKLGKYVREQEYTEPLSRFLTILQSFPFAISFSSSISNTS
jgi:hypothetical protein